MTPANPPPAEPSWTQAGSGTAPFDLLRMPVIGSFLRWRWSRPVLQVPIFLVALLMIAHAFLGPDLAPKKLATLQSWMYFRGLRSEERRVGKACRSRW